jgi:hypothetical protein
MKLLRISRRSGVEQRPHCCTCKEPWLMAAQPSVISADPSVISALGRAGRSGAAVVAGIALHFLVPSYALVLVGDAALGHAPHAWAAWLPHALGLGGWFLAAYGGATVLASGVAALADRRRCPPRTLHRVWPQR